MLALPRDELSIPIVRHICRDAMAEIGVADECSADIEVALTEACTNVLVHSGPGDDYEVHLRLSDLQCTIRVVDRQSGEEVRLEFRTTSGKPVQPNDIVVEQLVANSR